MKKIKTAILFSGGKDSCLALYYAMKHTDVQCLITIISESNDSYMFHVPNIQWAEKQAEAIGIPIIVQKTKGEKEKELKDLEKAIKIAIKKYKIQGVITGAVESVYQAARVQTIANKLNIECFNPLWQKNQMELLQELIDRKFEIIIVGVFGEGLDGFWGRKIDTKFMKDIAVVADRYKINPAGEGGELESFVLNAPFFKKKIEIKKSHILKDKHGGKVLIIEYLK